MLLSEAIRRGAKMHPQLRGDLYDGYGTCALGAAYVGAGIDVAIDRIIGREPACVILNFEEVMAEHPKAGHRTPLSGVIVSLNDHYEWTREAIADWLSLSGYDQEIRTYGLAAYDVEVEAEAIVKRQDAAVEATPVLVS